MATSVDLRSTDVKITRLAGTDGTFYMDLSNLYESLSSIEFSFDVYDGPDPDNDDTVDVSTTITTEGTSVYVTLEDAQANMSNDTVYYFSFYDSNDVSLCYGTLIRKGLR